MNSLNVSVYVFFLIYLFCTMHPKSLSSIFRVGLIHGTVFKKLHKLTKIKYFMAITNKGIWRINKYMWNIIISLKTKCLMFDVTVAGFLKMIYCVLSMFINRLLSSIHSMRTCISCSFGLLVLLQCYQNRINLYHQQRELFHLENLAQLDHL